VIIGHGRSDARAIRNAIRTACDFVQQEVVVRLKEALSQLSSPSNAVSEK